MVFWFNFSMMWTGITVPYTRVYEQYGWDFLLQPANLFVFCLTVFGLLVDVPFKSQKTITITYTLPDSSSLNISNGIPNSSIPAAY